MSTLYTIWDVLKETLYNITDRNNRKFVYGRDPFHENKGHVLFLYIV